MSKTRRDPNADYLKQFRAYNQDRNDAIDEPIKERLDRAAAKARFIWWGVETAAQGLVDVKLCSTLAEAVTVIFTLRKAIGQIDDDFQPPPDYRPVPLATHWQDWAEKYRAERRERRVKVLF